METNSIFDIRRTLYYKSPLRIRGLIGPFYEKVAGLVCLPLGYLAARKLKKEEGRSKSLEEYVDLAFSFKFGPFDIRPFQVKGEILRLMEILSKTPPEKILEIGAGNGGTLYLLARVASPQATLISIDLPSRPFETGYPKWRRPFYRSFGSPSQRICLLEMDSHGEGTFCKVKEILGGSKLDLLFIDGDHTYKGVKKDFEMYSPLVRPGGMVALHDIVPHPPEVECEVDKFWKEIREKFSTKELVESWDQAWAGIGIIYV